MTDTSSAIATAETLLMVARVSNAKHDHCRLMNQGGDAILSLVAEVERLQAALATARQEERDIANERILYVQKCCDERVLAARDDALEEAANFAETHVYTTNGGEKSMEPVQPKFQGMDQHHATLATAIRAMKGKRNA